jgi:hypothetical protein
LVDAADADLVEIEFVQSCSAFVHLAHALPPQV